MPRSPASWLETLEFRLHQRWNELGVYDAYFEGDHKLAFATAKWNEAFGATFAKITDNFMPILVEASAERLEVQGFRFGKQQEADDEAWDIWQANDLDEVSDEVHVEAIKLKESYWLVEPPKSRNDPPRITGEHPSQCIVACAPGNRRERLAGLKKWIDEDGFAYANVYLPNTVVKYRSQKSLRDGGAMYDGRVNWGAGQPFPNPLGEVPLIPVPNSPSMLRGGRSDLAGGPILLQNGINKILSDMLIGSEYQAFPQRVLTGVEIPKDPETGQPIRSAELKSSQARLWTFSSENAKATEFSSADLKNYIQAKDALLEDLAVQGRLPAPYVKAHIVNAAEGALKMAQDGLITRVKRRMRPMGNRHEDMMRLSFKSVGDEEKAKQFRAETIWRDPETRSQAELADALTKLKTIGVPEEILWERYGFSPLEIDRMKAMKEADALLNPPPVLMPPQPPGQPPVNGDRAQLPALAPADR